MRRNPSLWKLFNNLERAMESSEFCGFILHHVSVRRTAAAVGEWVQRFRQIGDNTALVQVL